MKIKQTLLKQAVLLLFAFSTKAIAQAPPQANFSISPNPACAGAVVHITDLSTNSPTSWSYTLNTGPGPAGTTTSSAQNPTITYVTAGTKTITLIATNASGASTAVSLTLQVIAAPNLNLTPNNPTACTGGSVTLTATTNSANTLSWSTGATTASVIVSPTATTVYSCTATNSAGCTATRATTVTIAQPTLTITGNPGSICGGGTASLIATLSGQAPFTYSWSTAVSTRTISTTMPGVYTATATNSSGCSATQSFTVGSITSITVAAQSTQSVICSGNNANLVASGASSYSWSNGVNTQVNMVTPTVSTTYTVIGTNGSCTASATVAIVVHTIPTIAITSTPNAVCAGGSATITASGATTYSWTTGDATATIIVTPTANATYTVRGVNQGCQPRTATVAIAISPGPLVIIASSADTTCAGQPVILAASGANTYSWNTGATTAIVTDSPSATTSYTVTGTTTAGCTGTTSIAQIVTECTGLRSLSLQSTALNIYPNPNSGNFTLATTVPITLNVISETGQLLKTLSLNEGNSYKAQVTNLASGIYFIVGQTASAIIKQKIIVQ